MFIGNSRFGKTETVEVEAIADPGRCRLVNTPASNAMSDLLREVAKSLGIEVGPGTSGRDLRDLIDYVLRFSHLQLIFDECQFLIEQNYSRNTAPARLNWVRRSIMDQGSPVVFVCTPQSYEPAKNRFVRATGFAMEQFDKRFYSVKLPERLGEADLFAVGRKHCGDLDEAYLQKVVGTVLTAKGNFVGDMEMIGTLAKDNALDHGRERPMRADIEAAIARVFPSVKPASPVQEAQPTSSIQRPCKRAAEPLPMPRSGLETLNRDAEVRA